MHQEVVTEKWVKKPSTATTTEVNIDRITSNKQGDNKNTQKQVAKRMLQAKPSLNCKASKVAMGKN